MGPLREHVWRRNVPNGKVCRQNHHTQVEKEAVREWRASIKVDGLSGFTSESGVPDLT